MFDRRAYNLAYNKAHREACTAATRRWRERNRDKALADQRKNRRNWLSDPANRKKDNDHSREWRAKNPERAREIVRQWHVNNRDRKNVHHQTRRTRKNGAVGSHTALQIALMFERQGGRCKYEGLGYPRCQPDLRKGCTKDHKTPISRGGSNWIRNIQLTCGPCNSAKNDKTDHEFRQWLATEYST